MGLFRKQTAEQHNSRLFGEVSLSVAPTYKNLTLIFSAIFFVALIFLVTANYHRKQVVFGQLKPSQSVVTARAPGQFIVADVFVDGCAVAQRDIRHLRQILVEDCREFF